MCLLFSPLIYLRIARMSYITGWREYQTTHRIKFWVPIETLMSSGGILFSSYCTKITFLSLFYRYLLTTSPCMHVFILYVNCMFFSEWTVSPSQQIHCSTLKSLFATLKSSKTHPQLCVPFRLIEHYRATYMGDMHNKFYCLSCLILDHITILVR